MSVFFFFKQKTAYDVRESDWSSDVCSSDLFPSHDSKGGKAELLEKLADGSKFVVLRAYKYEAELVGSFQQILNVFASKFSDGEGYITPNMSSILFELDNICLIVRL